VLPLDAMVRDRLEYSGSFFGKYVNAVRQPVPGTAIFANAGKA
jgi:hypothetical protein